MADLRKELKDRGVNMPGSAKKGDLVNKLRQVLESVGGPQDTSGDDLLSQSFEELTGGPTTATQTVAKTSPVKTAVASPLTSQTPSNEQPKTLKLVKQPGEGEGDVSTSPTKTVDTADKLAARAARFGIQSTSPSKSSATPVVSNVKTTEQLEALKKRSERFGEVVSPAVATLEVKEKLNQRANRFNLTADDKTGKGLGLIKKSLVVGGEKRSTGMTPEEEERMKKRRERFGLV